MERPCVKLVDYDRKGDCTDLDTGMPRPSFERRTLENPAQRLRPAAGVSAKSL